MILVAWLERDSTVSFPATEQRRFQVFLLIFVIFLVVFAVVLWAIGLFTARTYFIVCFLWLLVSSEVFAPSRQESLWWNRLQWVKAGGWIVLAYIVFERVVAVVQ